MRRALLLALLAAAPAVHAADAPAPAQPPDAVEQMKARYYEKFSALPPSRKCSAQDAAGEWVAVATLTAGAGAQLEATKETGKQYLAFGPYNMLLRQSSQNPLGHEALAALLPKTPLQYIMTSAGMLYSYKGGALESSQLCFVSNAASKDYASGLLILAALLEKNDDFTVTLYAPLGK